MEHEHIESVEHENHEAVENRERERGEDMADEAEHEELEAIKDFNDALNALVVKIHQSNMIALEARDKLGRVIHASHLRSVLTWMNTDTNLRTLIN